MDPSEYIELMLGFDLRVGGDLGLNCCVGKRKYLGCDRTCWHSPVRDQDLRPEDRVNRFLLPSISRVKDLAAIYENCICIAVSIILPIAQRNNLESQFEYLYPGDAVPSSVSENWQSIGYDVADQYLFSALCSIGALINSPVLHLLNEKGLFPDIHMALEGVVEADSRVSPHSPFLCVAIYEV